METLKLTNIETGYLNEFGHYFQNVDFYNQGANELYEAIEDECEENMKNSPEFWVAQFDYEGYSYIIAGDGELTSNGNFVVGRIIENEKVESNITLFSNRGNEDKQAICIDRESDTVHEFKNLREFTLDFQKLYVNGEIYGVYYNDNNNIVCETRDGNILGDILR